MLSQLEQVPTRWRRGQAPHSERSEILSDGSANARRLQYGLDLFLSKDMKAWTDLCAEDVVAEFPFAPVGTPAVIEGRAAFYEYLRGHPETIDVHTIPTTMICTTGDPDFVVMEWSVSGTVVAAGDPTRCATRPS